MIHLFFFVNDIKKRKQIITCLKDLNFGTKNLPDAIKWHCAFYWDHMLKKQIKKLSYTKNKLQTAIAIPIFINKKLSDYTNLTKKISKIF